MAMDTLGLQEGLREVSRNQEAQTKEPTSFEPDRVTDKSSDAQVTTAASSSESDGQKTTFKSRIAQYRTKLDNDFETFVAERAEQAQDNELEKMDWDELERRYNAEMGLQIAAERDIMNEFSQHFQQFSRWMQVSDEKEAERALKRLRTRIAFVCNSEEELSAKQEHYAKVLSAFQDAMALLSNL